MDELTTFNSIVDHPCIILLHTLALTSHEMIYYRIERTAHDMTAVDRAVIMDDLL